MGSGSEIGQAMASRLSGTGWSVSGSYFNSDADPKNVGLELKLHCDFTDKESIDRMASQLEASNLRFNLLLLAVGTLLPIGEFLEVDTASWESGFNVNFLGPARLVRRMLPLLTTYGPVPPHCIFLVGGGINSTTVSFSSYTLAKIALVKLAEILDAELPEIAVSSVGPGWVRTKIHRETLSDSRTPLLIRSETERRYRENDFVEMASVLNFLEWIISQPKPVVGGRNFSVSTDAFKDMSALEGLAEDRDLLKLRRRTR